MTNVRQTKITILVLQTVDWLLLIAVVSLGVHSIFFAEDGEIMTIVALIGLLLVSRVGQTIINKIAAMRIDMKIQQRNNK